MNFSELVLPFRFDLNSFVYSVQFLEPKKLEKKKEHKIQRKAGSKEEREDKRTGVIMNIVNCTGTAPALPLLCPEKKKPKRIDWDWDGRANSKVKGRWGAVRERKR